MERSITFSHNRNHCFVFNLYVLLVFNLYEETFY